MNTIFSFTLSDAGVDNILDIKHKIEIGTPLEDKEIQDLLQYLCHHIRQEIADYRSKDRSDYLFSSQCDLAQSMIYYYLSDDLSIPCKPLNTNEVLGHVCGHSFIIATFQTSEGSKKYLIDPTYVQFFSSEGCSESKFTIINGIVCTTPDPGYFVVRNDGDDTISFLLRNGYIELTPEVAEVYGNSFFQTKTGVPLKSTKDYKASGSSYINWFEKAHSARLSYSKDEFFEVLNSIRK